MYSLIIRSKNKEWHKDKKLYRKYCFNPAGEYSDGCKVFVFDEVVYDLDEDCLVTTWSLNSIILNSLRDRPARIYKNGTKEWYYAGYLHRDNDLPAIEYANGDKEWWILGKRNRDNGPAMVYGNKQCWFCHGEFVKCT
jgi:hypothetical protein